VADEEALNLLKQGPAAWNEQRRLGKFGGWDLGRAELGVADLRGADLRGADLSGADLSGADLREADLGGADLSQADLRVADLIGANLREADLGQADLGQADLRTANLSRANLSQADLGGADLGWADVSQSILNGTTFADIDLSAVRGLESVEHRGPSSIGIDTIYKSKGQIPEIFLRGAGVPEPFIVQMKALVAALEPIQFYSCFISYSFADQAFAERLHADLQVKGVRTWFATHDIKAGKKLHEQIDEAIRVHDKLLLVLSPQSMASEWVATEIAKARKREVREGRRMLFPLNLAPFDQLRYWELFDADTGKDSAREIREYFIPDFSNWKDHDFYRVAFDRLLLDLQASA
jgi:hypothetical protein